MLAYLISSSSSPLASDVDGVTIFVFLFKVQGGQSHCSTADSRSQDAHDSFQTSLLTYEAVMTGVHVQGMFGKVEYGPAGRSTTRYLRGPNDEP